MDYGYGTQNDPSFRRTGCASIWPQGTHRCGVSHTAGNQWGYRHRSHRLWSVAGLILGPKRTIPSCGCRAVNGGSLVGLMAASKDASIRWCANYRSAMCPGSNGATSLVVSTCNCQDLVDSEGGFTPCFIGKPLPGISLVEPGCQKHVTGILPLTCLFDAQPSSPNLPRIFLLNPHLLLSHLARSGCRQDSGSWSGLVVIQSIPQYYGNYRHWLVVWNIFYFPIYWK